MSVCVLISSKEVNHIGLRPTYMTSFYLNYFSEGPISKYSLILRDFNIYILKAHNSAHKTTILALKVLHPIQCPYPITSVGEQDFVTPKYVSLA